MEPLSTISTAITSIKTAIDIIKIIDTSEDQLDKSILKSKISELTELLVDTRLSIIDLKEEQINQQQEIQKLKELLKDKNEFKFSKYYYFEYKDSKMGEGPFCANCYDSKKIKVHLIPLENGRWICNSCKNEIYDDEYYSYKNQLHDAIRYRRMNNLL